MLFYHTAVELHMYGNKLFTNLTCHTIWWWFPQKWCRNEFSDNSSRLSTNHQVSPGYYIPSHDTGDRFFSNKSYSIYEIHLNTRIWVKKKNNTLTWIFSAILKGIISLTHHSQDSRVTSCPSSLGCAASIRLRSLPPGRRTRELGNPRDFRCNFVCFSSIWDVWWKKMND